MAYNIIFNEEKWEKVNPENKIIIQDYITECKARKKKESTIRQYGNDLRIIMIFVLEKCGNRPVTELNRKDFRKMILWLTDELGVSNARANRLMSCCRSLLAYLEEDDDYDYDINQAAKVKGLGNESVREIVFLDRETIDKLYDYFMSNRKYRDATLLALGIESSGRKAELSQVLKDSITDDGHYTNIVVGKRGKKFPLIYFNHTREAAKKYLEQRGEDNIPELFITKYDVPARKEVLYDMVVSWRPIIKELTGKDLDVNVHSLRHSALQLYKTGENWPCTENNLGPIPLDQLKNIARHSSVETTLGYLIDDTENELANALGISVHESFSENSDKQQ